jgi:hypothetical protein
MLRLFLFDSELLRESMLNKDSGITLDSKTVTDHINQMITLGEWASTYDFGHERLIMDL